MSPVAPGNPWLDIPAADYEAHMGPRGADQLSALSRIFGDVYVRLRPRRLAVLGCATGNGFQHIKLEWTERLLAVDINPRYLDILQNRHKRLEPVLETVNVPAEECSPGPASLDLVSAALLFEYVDPVKLLDRIFSWLAPGGKLSVVLQLPSQKHGVVTKTGHDSLKVLESVIRLVPPTEFETHARATGLRSIEAREHALQNAKSFYVGLFERALPLQ